MAATGVVAVAAGDAEARADAGVGAGDVAAVAEMAAVADAVAGLPASAEDASDAQLTQRLRELARVRAVVDAALVQQLAAFDARSAARRDGATSTVAWLRSRLRLGGQAVVLLQVARQLDSLPRLAEALAGGQVSLEHAAQIARLAAQVGAGALDGYEQALVQLAGKVPPAVLGQACARLRQLLDADGAEVDAAGEQRRRYLAAARTLGGMVHLQGLLDAASGDVVLAALDAAMPAAAEHEPRTPAQRRADALADVCAGWLAAGEAPTSGGIRPQVQVTVDLPTLRQPDRRAAAETLASNTRSPAANAPDARTQDEPARRAEQRARQQQEWWRADGRVPQLADGTVVAASVARRLACDAGVIPVVLGAASEIVDIGRHTRVVPVGLRRLLNLRDRGCRFPGCDRPATWSDAHHLQHWANGGPTNAANCVLLCAYHHTLVHQGWRIHGNPNRTLHFHRPDGTRLDLTSAPRGPTG